MAYTLDFEPFLRKLVTDVVPDLVGRFFPYDGVQDESQAYAVYSQVGYERWSSQDGPLGTSAATYQIDAWSKTRSEAGQLADAVAGNRDTPGLAGWAGEVTVTGIGTLKVQRINQTNGFGDFEPGEQAQQRGWFRVSKTYTVYFEEEVT